MANQKTDFFSRPDEVEKMLLRTDISFNDSQNLYKKWAESGTYDDIHGTTKIYRGVEMFGQTMATLFPDKSSVKILDVGAGTGLCGQKLQTMGYRNIDALEPIESFAEMCCQGGCYSRVLVQSVGFDKPVDVPDDTYDAVCTVGTFAAGAIPTSAIPEFVRIVKPGGYFLNCMREEYLWTVTEFKEQLVPLLKQLEVKGRLQQLEWKTYPCHFNDKGGLRMLYKVL